VNAYVPKDVRLEQFSQALSKYTPCAIVMPEENVDKAVQFFHVSRKSVPAETSDTKELRLVQPCQAQRKFVPLLKSRSDAARFVQ
jgi:hypothetical protein